MIPKTMRALVAHGQGDYRLEEIPVPAVGPDAIAQLEGSDDGR